MLKCGVHKDEMLLCLLLRSGHVIKIVDVAEKVQSFTDESSDDNICDVLTGSSCCCPSQANERLISVK